MDSLEQEPLDLALARDPLMRMRAYQLARQLADFAWKDCEVLKRDVVTEKVAGQLYAAVGSIAANMGEGYSRSSGRDRARIFEYALGSTRESIAWYHLAGNVLGDETTNQRLATLIEIRKLLLVAIPRERTRVIRPDTHT